jgi:hypothetical protein
MHEIACFYIYYKTGDKEKSKELIRGDYPNLLRSHRFHIGERDTKKILTSNIVSSLAIMP